MIGRDHRRAIGCDQIAKQPQLGGKIMRDVGMVIHVVARQVGEAAGVDPDPVQPELIEPVRGRLEREMGDALAGDFIELPMQRNRIRRRQRSVDGSLRRYQADGADAGRGMAEPLPDLAREGGDGSLAAGAGDGGDGRGLPRIKLRRRQRQRATRIGGADKRHAAVGRRRMIARHRHRAGCDGSVDEARAVGLAAGEREEQIARLDRAAVRGEAGHHDRFGLAVDRGVIAEQVAESHDLPVGRR